MNLTTLDRFDNNEYQVYCSAAQLEKDLNILKGILLGIASDNTVNHKEVNIVKDWIDAVRDYERYYPYRVFITNLKLVIEDNIITDDELKDLIWLCDQYLNKDNPYYNIITSATQTLTGVLTGITADGIINDQEITFLCTWLEENQFLAKTWLFDELYNVVSEIIITKNPSSYLLDKIHKLSAMVSSDLGDSDNSSLIENIKIDIEEHQLLVEGRTFCITGNSLYNTRREIAEMIESAGGKVLSGVSSKLDYLLICDEKNSCWAFSSYGRKVEKALELQKKESCNLAIVYEVDFYRHIDYSV